MAADPGDQSERPGPDLLRPRHFPAACTLVEGEEKVVKALIGVGQVPFDAAKGPLPAQAPSHHDGPLALSPAARHARARARLFLARHGVGVIVTSRAVIGRTRLRSLNSPAPSITPRAARGSIPQRG